MRTNKLLTVIHAESQGQALRNADIAFENGADGIFLINHSISSQVLREIYRTVRQFYRSHWIGLNFLDESTSRSISLLPDDANAIWMDDVGFNEDEGGGFVRTVADLLKSVHPEVTLFAGFDFKYQRPVKDLPQATRLMAGVVDVITTSGEATGSPPNLRKIQVMRAAAPEAKIAIASGMTPENVEPFLDLADYFLVATGISDSHTELNADRVRQMADKMRR